MALLTDAFHLTRVINLPERKDRYKDTVRLLAKLGTKFRAGSVELYVAKAPD